MKLWWAKAIHTNDAAYFLKTYAKNTEKNIHEILTRAIFSRYLVLSLKCDDFVCLFLANEQRKKIKNYRGALDPLYQNRLTF